MDKLEIFNSALAVLPHDRRIQYLDENSTEALRCHDAWTPTKRKMLATHEWGWATSACMNVGSAFPTKGAPSTFPRPGDALRVIGLFDHKGRRVKAQVRNGQFISYLPAVELRYIPDLADDTIVSWPSWFCEAVVWELASRIAPLIKGKADRQLEQTALRCLNEAERIDSSEVAWSGTDGRTFVRARR